MSIDKDGRDALAVAERLLGASSRGFGDEAGLTTVTRALVEDAVDEIRWLVESRARWQAACEVRQITLFEEEHR